MPEDYTGFLAFTHGRQHSAGRFLEVDRWAILEISPGKLSVDCHVPEHVLNLGGFMFGGFTPTYVDYVAIWTVMTTMQGEMAWITTVNMRIDYLEPIYPENFRIDSHLVNKRKYGYLVETRFTRADDTLLAFAITNLRELPNRTLREI